MVVWSSDQQVRDVDKMSEDVVKSEAQRLRQLSLYTSMLGPCGTIVQYQDGPLTLPVETDCIAGHADLCREVVRMTVYYLHIALGVMSSKLPNLLKHSRTFHEVL